MQEACCFHHGIIAVLQEITSDKDAYTHICLVLDRMEAPLVSGETGKGRRSTSQDQPRCAAMAQKGDCSGMGTDEIKGKARRLIAAANELLAIAHELELSEGGREHGAASTMHAVQDSPIWAEVARTTYRERRYRADIFKDPTLFGEPAWDILLDLFIAAKERKRLPVTSACIGAAVPATTALRWLTVLEEKGLIVRENDTADARRVFVRLSADGYEKMVAYFAAVAGDLRNEEIIAPAAMRIAN